MQEIKARVLNQLSKYNLDVTLYSKDELDNVSEISKEVFKSLIESFPDDLMIEFVFTDSNIEEDYTFYIEVNHLYNALISKVMFDVNHVGFELVLDCTLYCYNKLEEANYDNDIITEVFKEVQAYMPEEYIKHELLNSYVELEDTVNVTFDEYMERTLDCSTKLIYGSVIKNYKDENK